MHWSQFITHNIMSFTPLAHAHNVLICCLIIKDCHLISAVHICRSHLSNSTLQHHLSSCSCLFKYNAHSAFIHSAILPTHPARIFFFLSFQHESLQIFNIHITFFFSIHCNSKLMSDYPTCRRNISSPPVLLLTQGLFIEWNWCCCCFCWVFFLN